MASCLSARTSPRKIASLAAMKHEAFKVDFTVLRAHGRSTNRINPGAFYAIANASYVLCHALRDSNQLSLSCRSSFLSHAKKGRRMMRRPFDFSV